MRSVIWLTSQSYLTSIMDLYSRKIIAWTLSETMEVSCVVETVKQAKARRDTDLPLILHSDRGSQYVSKAYREVTEKFQLSYSHKGYPYDNACIESFHSLIKREWLSRFKIENRDHAYRLVFEYIEAFYNTVRIHSHCGYMSPDQFEKLKANVACPARSPFRAGFAHFSLCEMLTEEHTLSGRKGSLSRFLCLPVW